MGRPALELPGEARQDWELIVELAQRIGLGWKYDHVSDVYAEMASTMPSLRNISWERIDREDSVIYPSKAPDRPGEEIAFVDGFPTADGRGKIVPADLLPPDELPDAEYPLVLTTGRLLEHWHTGAMTRRAGVLDAIEPVGIAAMNPRDMQKRGLRQGDRIIVETRRGRLDAILRADREVADGSIFMPFCFAESPANRLTNPKLDPFGKIPEFKYCAARVERIRQPAAHEAAALATSK
jgi:formate dehydrogenase major subunit